MMNKNNQYAAAALYAGGWRAEDAADLMREYKLTREEAEEICAELKELEAQEYASLIDKLGGPLALLNLPDRVKMVLKSTDVLFIKILLLKQVLEEQESK